MCITGHTIRMSVDKYSATYLSKGALGPVQDYETVGEEESIHRIGSKFRVQFDSNSFKVSQDQEPRYTPSKIIQEHFCTSMLVKV